MNRPAPPDKVRCTAVARWTGNGKGRCRKAAYGSSRLCPMHAKFPPRPERERSSLVEFLATAPLGEGKEIRVELRVLEDEEFLSVRLYLGDVPTRKAFHLSPRQLGELHAALDRALDRLDGVAR